LTRAVESSVHPRGPPGPLGPSRERAAWEGSGALMSEAEVRESVTLAGRAERTHVARTFTGQVIGAAHPRKDDAVLLVSELFSNSLQYSRSGAPGGTVTITVTSGGGIVRVAVIDRSGRGVPHLCLADDDTEGGRGLRLVAGLAQRWGWRRRGGRTVTWFEFRDG